MIDRIKKALKKQAMTIEEVSTELEISRATASKYLLALQLTGAVDCRIIGKAKLFSLR